MANSSLAYEILLYLNSFYFGLFAACEIGMGALKGINLTYTPQQLQTDALILVAILIVETIRVYFGRKGSLSEHGWQVITSVFLTIPCIAGVYYLLMLQHKVLKLELILCALMLVLQSTELLYATVFLLSHCRPKTYG